MARDRAALIPATILVFCLGIGRCLGQEAPIDLQPLPEDTTGADTLAARDTLVTAPEDTVQAKPVLELPTEEIPPYYKTTLLGKTWGDYLRYQPGFLSLQNGPVGQAEMLTKSEMLPGIGANCNGIPFFGQGYYFPFRNGLDLTYLMFENVGTMEITPMGYLGLFDQGEILSMQAMVWPPEENPSSVTIGRGPFGYERSGWRFSRLFTKNIGASFTAGFDKSSGYYVVETDYDAFGITGSLAIRPRPNTEIDYSFYQRKGKQALLQFDRVLPPFLRLNHDINLHTLRAKHQRSERLYFELDLFNQNNTAKLFGEGVDYTHRVRDYIWGGSVSVSGLVGRHHLTARGGGRRHYFNSIGSGSGRLVTTALVLGDSIIIDSTKDLRLLARGRHDNVEGTSAGGTGSFGWKLTARLSVKLSAGRLDYMPDIYALYFKFPVIVPEENGFVNSYVYVPDPGLESTRLSFLRFDLGHELAPPFRVDAGIAAERVKNDLVFQVSEVSSAEWTSTQKNLDYDRATASLVFAYKVTRFFEGQSGATYFVYDPEGPLPGTKYTPSVILYSVGQLKITNVLRDIDLSGEYQLRFMTEREYAGFSSALLGQSRYDRAIEIDGAISVRFGSFTFRLCENNILDFFGVNSYSAWDNYLMPPGMVWWQFTWDFSN